MYVLRIFGLFLWISCGFLNLFIIKKNYTCACLPKLFGDCTIDLCVCVCVCVSVRARETLGISLILVCTGFNGQHTS